MLDCSKCQWKHPDTCKTCRETQKIEDRAYQITSGLLLLNAQGYINPLVIDIGKLEPIEVNPSDYDQEMN